jgi:hypothetical protein
MPSLSWLSSSPTSALVGIIKAVRQAGSDDLERWLEEFAKLSGRGDSRGWKFNRDELQRGPVPAAPPNAALLGFVRKVSARCHAEVDARGARLPHETEQLLLMLWENAEMFLSRPARPSHRAETMPPGAEETAARAASVRRRPQRPSRRN